MRIMTLPLLLKREKSKLFLLSNEDTERMCLKLEKEEVIREYHKVVRVTFEDIDLMRAGMDIVRIDDVGEIGKFVGSLRWLLDNFETELLRREYNHVKKYGIFPKGYVYSALLGKRIPLSTFRKIPCVVRDWPKIYTQNGALPLFNTEEISGNVGKKIIISDDRLPLGFMLIGVIRDLDFALKRNPNMQLTSINAEFKPLTEIILSAKWS